MPPEALAVQVRRAALGQHSPLVIEDAVGDKELAQELPNVPVGPVLQAELGRD